MQYRSITSLALMALATTATAQQSRVFTRASQSVREFDIFARQSDGYQPEDEICGGEGSTCAEACGDGYQECASSDESVHCYNPAQEESCCASGNGSSCLSSFFCARDSETGTFCCPGGSSLEECAVEFGVVGALVSDAPAAPTSSSSSAVAESTSEVVSSSSVVVVVSSSSIEISSALPTSEVSSSFYANSTSSYEPSYTVPVEATTTVVTDSSATSGSSDETEDEDDTEDSGATAHGPIMALVAAVAMLTTLF